MSTKSDRPPRLWANKKYLPEIKQELRKKVPELTDADVRRIRLPFYEAIAKEFYEIGFKRTANAMEALVALEEDLFQRNVVNIRLLERKDFLMVIANIAKIAEQEAFHKGNLNLAIQMLLELVLVVEGEGKDFLWLAGQMYNICFRMIDECEPENHEARCRTRFHYASFLDQKVELYDEAIKQFKIAKEESENMNWVTNRVTFNLLFRDVCRGYIAAVLHKAHGLQSTNLKEAESLMEFAMPIMYRYANKVDICEELIVWSNILMDLKDLEKAELILTKALKYGYICSSTQHRCLIMLKQGLVYHSLNNVKACEKKFKMALSIADEFGYSHLRALTRMHFGFVYSKQPDKTKTGINLLEEAIDIFKTLGNQENLQKAAVFLAMAKANQIFDDVCFTIRAATKSTPQANDYKSKWQAWRYHNHVNWETQDTNEESEEDDGKNEETLEEEIEDSSLDGEDSNMDKEVGLWEGVEEHSNSYTSLGLEYLFEGTIHHKKHLQSSSYILGKDKHLLKDHIDSAISKIKEITAEELGYAPKRFSNNSKVMTSNIN